jgi:hypothetical protein
MSALRSAVLVGLLAVTGCGSGDENVTQTLPRSEAQAAAHDEAISVPASLRGSWTRRMRARDWEAGEVYPIGTWKLEVNARGDVDVQPPGADTADFSTRFVVAGLKLTIDSVPICPGMKGRYRWRAAERALRLAVLEDECGPRVALFGGEWRQAAR